MPTIIETIDDYNAHLSDERNLQDKTLRRINLSLKYLCELYGTTETDKLTNVDMVIFRNHMQTRKKEVKNSQWEYTTMSLKSVGKTMATIKTYVGWLKDKCLLWPNLTPADVPLIKVTHGVPKFLEEEELALIVTYLEENIIAATKTLDKELIYTAYMRRALVWFLYVTGLRNEEIRSITYADVNFNSLSWTIIGKGGKLGIITFNEVAREKMLEYLAMRKQLMPSNNSPLLFIPYYNKEGIKLSEYGLNRILQKISTRAWVKQHTTAHLYRHTLATHLAMAGRSIVAIREKMRHSNASVTSIYMHIRPKDLIEITKEIGSNLLTNRNTALNSIEDTMKIMHELLMHVISSQNTEKDIVYAD